LGTASDNFGGLWQLANGGNGSLYFINGVNLNPVGTNNSPNYTFSLPVASLGIAPDSGATFGLFGTYISTPASAPVRRFRATTPATQAGIGSSKQPARTTRSPSPSRRRSASCSLG
jgi:hypothetical protein